MLIRIPDVEPSFLCLEGVVREESIKGSIVPIVAGHCEDLRPPFAFGFQYGLINVLHDVEDELLQRLLLGRISRLLVTAVRILEHHLYTAPDQ